MMTERGGWRTANEDTLSTGSGSGSDSERNLPPGSSESVLLRMPNVRRLSGVPKQKAVITALAFTVLLIVSSMFGVLYFSSGDGGGNKDNKLSVSSLMDHDIFVRDISNGEDASTRSGIMHSDSDSGEHDDDYELQQDQPSRPLALPQRNSTRRNNRRKKPNRTRNQNGTTVIHDHGPRPLPQDAQDIPAFSLLYEMKLVHGRHASFVNYSKCQDTNLDGRLFFRGWKAVVPVNLTAAGISDKPSVFMGYGRQKGDARRRAAESALTVLYPGKLEYSGKDELREIDEFCKYT